LKKILFVFLFAAIAFTGGCRTVRYGSYPPAGPDAEQERSGDYLIMAHDTMEVLVYDNPDLNIRVQVSPSGTVSLPLIGSVEVRGLTTPQAEEMLQDRLSEYIVNPRVNVTVPQIAERVIIYVSGQVRSPGSYRLTPGMTAYQAITVAGGMTSIAAPNHTRVVRTYDGKQETIPVRVAAMLRSGDMSGDVALMPGDTIIVPESFF
jgi:polysaccharide biosynthesis/export protein